MKKRALIESITGDMNKIPDLNTKVKLHLKKAKNHDYKYINPIAVKNIIGKWTPISLWNFSYLLECFIGSMNTSGSSMMNSKGTYLADIESVSKTLIGVGDKLLESNRRYKSGSWELYNELDFDITHCCIKGKDVETMVQPYFAHKELRRNEEARVVLHATVAQFEGTSWTISIPLQYIMQGYPKIKNQHYGYCHKIAVLNEDGSVDNEYIYVGITGRNWLQRMSEHFNEIKSGSNKLFHQTWREFTGKQNVMLSSELVIGDHTYEQIMSWEEDFVDRYMAAGVSLNMIPGGFKGMKFLHKHRLLGSDNVSLKERDRAVLEYQRQHPRAGLPNLLISELWKDDDYAAKIICGAEGRLSIEQVQKIRELNNHGIPVNKIVEMVKARNVRQVLNVLKGSTYTRIN